MNEQYGPNLPPMGHVIVRANNVGIKLVCDAMATARIERANAIMMLSCAGPASVVKAVTAAMRGTAKVTFAFLGDAMPYVNEPVRHEAGYRCYRTKLADDLYHVLFVADEPNFLPIFDKDALWDELRSNRWTTPIRKEWMDWLMGQIVKHGLRELQSFGCAPAYLHINQDMLDQLVSKGVAKGILALPSQGHGELKDIGSMADYVVKNGEALAQQAQEQIAPLHVPGRDPVVDCSKFLRTPYEPQQHAVTAMVKALKRQKAILLGAEMGVGKTVMTMCAAHAHANGKPYRAIVMCPGQLAMKWGREVESTIPNVRVIQLKTWEDVVAIDRHAKLEMAEWYILPRDRAKLGCGSKPAFNTSRRMSAFLKCPQCGGRIVSKDGLALSPAALAKNRSFCERVIAKDDGEVTIKRGCGAALWQMTGKPWRYEPALYIKRRLRKFFRYLVLDEAHELKGGESVAQANAAGALMSACSKVFALTGTTTGGKADDLRLLLFRMAAKSLRNEGLEWQHKTEFNERYGRIETRITEKEGGDADNAMSRGRGKRRTVTKKVVPGIMPHLFGRHLMDKTVFLALDDVASNLPPLDEDIIGVPLDAQQANAYQMVEERLRGALRDMLIRNDRRLLGAFLQTLLAYPDLPFGWKPVGYWHRHEGEGQFIEVVDPPKLAESVIRPKEKALIDFCLAEKALGRKVWVYVQFVGEHDVQSRIVKLLNEAGLTTKCMLSSVDPAKRETWMAKNVPGCDVVVSHPRLVETGLDFFAKNYNVPTIVWYEFGYSLFTLRQASRRSWRIGQKQTCKVRYFYYEGTMQARALALMGSKMQASKALEGRFDEGGLAAMGGGNGDSMEMALAKSLADQLELTPMRRVWRKIGDEPTPTPAPTAAVTTAKAKPARKPRAADWLVVQQAASALLLSKFKPRDLRKIAAKCFRRVKPKPKTKRQRKAKAKP